MLGLCLRCLLHSMVLLSFAPIDSILTYDDIEFKCVLHVSQIDISHYSRLYFTHEDRTCSNVVMENCIIDNMTAIALNYEEIPNRIWKQRRPERLLM